MNKLKCITDMKTYSYIEELQLYIRITASLQLYSEVRVILYFIKWNYKESTVIK